MRAIRILLSCALACAVLPGASLAQAATPTVITAKRIHTMDATRPTAEAMAFDGDGRILALGSTPELLARYPQARRIDAGTATLVPGLIDAHGHVSGLGATHLSADLVGTTSKDDVLRRLREFARDLPAGAWLLGRGWDQNDWDDRRFPGAADLDTAFPDRPVWLERVDGHAGWANTAAMKAVKRDLSGTWQPDGGRIERDANARATGIFVDGAMALVYRTIPAPDDATLERMLSLGMQDAVAHGLTGVHDAGVSLRELQAYRRLADAGRMPLRIDAMADGDSQALAWVCENGLYVHPSQRLRMQAVKLYADGALGSRGAALLADYSDDAGNRGLMVTSPAELSRLVAKAHGCGLQVATHAIGDRGNQVVLDTYAKVLGPKANGDHRWRIEHAQVLAPEDLPRLAALHVIASMQPTHATSDMPWAEDRLGPQRIHGAYAWRQLRDSGVRLALGSDFPVESVDPRLGLYAATTRQDAQGMPAGGWHPQDRLTAWEALRGFTLDAAYAGFDEHMVGSLEAGKRADFVILAEDPLGGPAEQLRSLTVESTWVDGRPVFERKAGAAP